jgi:hypothetical protein
MPLPRPDAPPPELTFLPLGWPAARQPGQKTRAQNILFRRGTRSHADDQFAAQIGGSACGYQARASPHRHSCQPVRSATGHPTRIVMHRCGLSGTREGSAQCPRYERRSQPAGDAVHVAPSSRHVGLMNIGGLVRSAWRPIP